MFACAAVAVVCARVSRGVIELVGLRSLQLVSGETVQSSLVIMTIETVHYNTTRHCSGSLIADTVVDEAVHERFTPSVPQSCILYRVWCTPGSGR